jgi:hypothetical protein
MCWKAPLLYFLLAQSVSLLLDLFAVSGCSARHKELPILVLRQQLRIRQRPRSQTPRLSRWETLTLAVLANKLNHFGHDAKTKLDAVRLLFKPQTVLRWQRDLVRRKWTCTQPHMLGRPATDPAIKERLLRWALENPRWGDGKRPGERLKLGDKLGRSTISDLLQRQQVPENRRERPSRYPQE